MTSCRRTLIIGAVLLTATPHIRGDQPDSENSNSLVRFEFLQVRMAVPVRITVYAPTEAIANQATAAAYRRFKDLDRIMSDYSSTSELSLLSRQGRSGVPQRVSRDLFTVLQRAQEIAHVSDGAFDVTVGPLTELWRKVCRRRELPAPEELRALLATVGWQNLRLDHERQTVEFALPDMTLDLGGIAKGYAADEALKVMRDLGVTSALIDAGGDVVAGEAPPGAESWTVGIAPLDDPRGPPDRFLKIRNMAVATSGDAAQHVELDGVRYSHIVDPRTGLGVTTPSSVTVIADRGMTADALASAISVLGPQRGLALVRAIAQAEALIVTRDPDDGRQVWQSAGMDSYLDAAQSSAETSTPERPEPD